MNIFIMRHGDADTKVHIDDQRPLTEQGILEVKVMAKWLANENVEFDAVFVSPYLRAQQSAQTLTTELNASAVLHTLDLITPAGSASEVHDYLDGTIALERYNNILIVSHMPLVSYLLAEMSFEKSAPIFSTAAIAQIDYNTKLMAGHIVNHVCPGDFC
ncbi:phosphohistidine phosphatase SixA [Thalassotalea nanhaiensis]|uniref:Phosphohistidine phosphatase SixA n=1 Tax=Thalassotalea nanhaiensis TaxID=3065648 RepID=A0ABY9TME3_9GAMM|nr:phosphohistidine phosphatase SixA [Colwelliaceae bacterium SQ345]